MSTSYHRLNPVRFLLDRPTEGATDEGSTDPVEAPTFSLTKVTAAIATLVGPAVAAIAKAFTDESFTTGQYTTMFIGLVGFLAVVVAADVIARAVAASAEIGAKAEGKTRDAVAHFDDPMPASLTQPGRDADVGVLAFAAAGGGRFLVVDDDRRLSWVAGDRISFTGAGAR